MQCSSFHDIFLTTIPYHPILIHSCELQIVSIGIVIVLISHHPVPPKRSAFSSPLPIWRYYHAFRTFSTVSKLSSPEARRLGDPVEPLRQFADIYSDSYCRNRDLGWLRFMARTCRTTSSRAIPSTANSDSSFNIMTGFVVDTKSIRRSTESLCSSAVLT